MIPLYMDEDSMSGALVVELRRRAVDVVTAEEMSRRRTSDLLQLSYATDLRRTICTRNVRDFARLHAEFLATGLHHAGIIAIGHRQQAIGEQIRRMLRLLEARSPEQMQDTLEFLSNW